jgi:hypothetical protein
MTVRQNSGVIVHKNQSPRVRDRKVRAQARQTRWESLSTAEKLQQKIDQGHGDTTEAEVLRMRLDEEMNGP